MRRFIGFLDALSFLAIAWGVLAVLPVESFWYRPGAPVVEDTSPHEVPAVSFDREILRDVRISYTVVIRPVESMTPLCDPKAGPFTYRRADLLPEVVDLSWWTGGDQQCWPQEPGTYLMETCWTVAAPFGGIVPPKTTCRQSPPFRVEERVSAVSGPDQSRIKGGP